MAVTHVVITDQDLLQRLLPASIAETVRALGEHERGNLQEIRLRANRPLELVGVRERAWPVVSAADIRHVLATVTGSSLHAVEADLRSGFITAPGGHRVGLAGRVVLEGDGRMKTFRDVASMNIRVAAAATDSARILAPYLIDGGGRLHNALLIGPPLSGKTTLLRDAARLLATGQLHPRLARQRVVIVDERSEIAGCVQGVPQFDVGWSTDVLDGCPKVEGMMMALRALSPQVIVTDELGDRADAMAVQEVARAGVALLGSAHGKTYADVMARPAITKLLSSGAITRLLLLDCSRGPGQLGRVLDSTGREVTRTWL